MTLYNNDPEQDMERYSLKGLYQSFAGNTFEGVMRSTLSGEILFCNDLFCSTFGYLSPGQATGANFAIHFEDDNFRVVKEVLLARRMIQAEKLKLTTTDGKPVTGMINACISDEGAGNRFINWTILDITAGTASEEELQRKKQELEKVNGMMEKFLYSTSHDLRSPVTSILGLVHLMKLETRDQVLHDYIGKVEHCATKLDLIIRDLMGFSKTSYQRAKSTRIELRRMVEEVIEKHRSDTNFQAISFEVVANEAFPFYSDRDRLEIILDNVVRNAIHFRDPSKARSVVRITVKVTIDEAYLEVHDNGIGIGRSHQNSIFNMFYKASNLSRGAGLGLYIAKESLQQINGTIKVESELGFGSIFRIRISNDDKGKLIGKKILLSAPRE